MFSGSYEGVDIKTRPDYAVFLSQVTPVVDVTTVSNLSTTYRTQSDPTEGAARLKINKHSAAVASTDDDDADDAGLVI